MVLITPSALRQKEMEIVRFKQQLCKKEPGEKATMNKPHSLDYWGRHGLLTTEMNPASEPVTHKYLPLCLICILSLF